MPAIVETQFRGVTDRPPAGTAVQGQCRYEFSIGKDQRRLLACGLGLRCARWRRKRSISMRHRCGDGIDDMFFLKLRHEFSPIYFAVRGTKARAEPRLWRWPAAQDLILRIDLTADARVRRRASSAASLSTDGLSGATISTAGTGRRGSGNPAVVLVPAVRSHLRICLPGPSGCGSARLK